jgi:hypothetical protein
MATPLTNHKEFNMPKLPTKERCEEVIEDLRYEADRLRRVGPELLYADLAARVTRRFPRVAYWMTQAVGARNIEDDEVVFDVSFMDVLSRQFLKTKAISNDG